MSEEDREDPDQNIRDIFDENDALNLAAVAFVHATKFEPCFEENGSVLLGTGLNEGRPVEKGFRTSVHFGCIPENFGLRVKTCRIG